MIQANNKNKLSFLKQYNRNVIISNGCFQFKKKKKVNIKVISKSTGLGFKFFSRIYFLYA